MKAQKEQHRSLGRDVIVCVRLALFIATAFSGWVLALYALRGNAPFDKLGTRLDAVILFYFCVAILVGPLVGLLLPLARARRLGAALVGTLGAILVYAMALVTLEGFTWLTPGTLLALVGLALFVGAPVGMTYRRMFGSTTS